MVKRYTSFGSWYNIIEAIAIAGSEMFDFNSSGSLSAYIRNKLVHYGDKDIISLGEKTIPYLIDYLDDENPSVRSRSARILGNFKTSQVIQALIEHIEDPFCTLEIVKALERFHVHSAVPAFQYAYNHYDPQVRMVGERALRNLGIAPERMYQEEHVDMYSQDGGIILEDTLSNPIQDLVKQLGSNDRGEWQEAMDVLINKGKKVVPGVIRGLQYKNPQVRNKCAVILGIIKDERAVHPLIKVLDDNVSEVQINAIQALRNIGFASVSPLIERLTSRKVTIQQLSIWALGEIGDSRAVEALIQQALTGNNDVQIEAIVALGKIGDVKAEEPLRALLSRELNPLARTELCISLGKIADPHSTQELENIVENDNDHSVRKSAQQALKCIAVHSLYYAPVRG